LPDFRIIPSIDELRQRSTVRALEERFGRDATVTALRHAAAAIRTAIAGGDRSLANEAAVTTRIESDAASELGDAFRASLQPVINATGVVVHTNLGRAPLADVAIERVGAVARGYASLEYDLVEGARGRRDVHGEALLCRLTGAAAASVVNNNAAATMLVLAALAAGREVIVSRGELVEIGGGFRVPDVMAQSGAVLREVGTTNKTRASDYAAAISDRTALILRVHPSNFRIEGFTARPALADVVAVGKQFNIPVAEDLGSGFLSLVISLTPASLQPHASLASASTPASLQPHLRDEPAVRDSVADGVDVCCFSGDKLLGGPQAGIIVGRSDLLAKIRTHPLMRALRVDKMTYAALEATLTEYVAGRATTTVPVQRMLTMTVEEIHARADALATAIRRMPGWRAELVEGVSAVGGGSAPGVELPTRLVALEKIGLSPDALEARLRRLTPPVIARIECDRLVLDLRTVLPNQDRQLAALLSGA
jgi:L-seryl-tRNA(Ser) seleniumtransferase